MTISDMIDNIYNINLAIYDDKGRDLITSEDLKPIIKERWGSRECMYNSKYDFLKSFNANLMRDLQRYNYGRIIDAIKAEYNPIENYNSTENKGYSEKNAPTLVTTTSYNERDHLVEFEDRKDTKDYVDRENIVTYNSGEKNVRSGYITDSKGKKTEKTNYQGGQTQSFQEDTTITNDTTGYNNSGFVPDTKSRTERGADDNKQVQTYNDRCDIVTIYPVTDTTTYNQLTDNASKNGSDKTSMLGSENYLKSGKEHNYEMGSESVGQTGLERNVTGGYLLTRSGNIGVTTNQQMIESEIKLRLYDLIIPEVEVWINRITFNKYYCGGWW